jgi:hypothetical protein
VERALPRHDEKPKGDDIVQCWKSTERAVSAACDFGLRIQRQLHHGSPHSPGRLKLADPAIAADTTMTGGGPAGEDGREGGMAGEEMG